MLQLWDALRFFSGGNKKKEPLFKSEQEAYDFCRRAFKETGGATDELRRAFEVYQQNLNDDCREFTGPLEAKDLNDRKQTLPQAV